MVCWYFSLLKYETVAIFKSTTNWRHVKRGVAASVFASNKKQKIVVEVTGKTSANQVTWSVEKPKGQTKKTWLDPDRK